MKTFFRPFMLATFFVLLCLFSGCQQSTSNESNSDIIETPTTPSAPTTPGTPTTPPETPTNPEISEEEFKTKFLVSFNKLYLLEKNKPASQNALTKLMEKGSIEDGLVITNLSNISYDDRKGFVSAIFDGKIVINNSTKEFKNKEFTFSDFKFPFDDQIISMPSLKINTKKLFDENKITKENFISAIKSNEVRFLTFENEENNKAILYNNTAIELFSETQNYETKIKAISEKNNGFEIEIEYNVFYHSKLPNEEDKKEVVSKNTKTFLIDWYSEADVFDYVLQDPNLVKTSVIPGYASEYYAKNYYQNAVNPIWSQFFDVAILKNYENKFSINGTLIVAIPNDGIGANDVEGKLYINEYYITTQEYFEANNSGVGEKFVRSKNSASSRYSMENKLTKENLDEIIPLSVLPGSNTNLETFFTKYIAKATTDSVEITDVEKVITELPKNNLLLVREGTNNQTGEPFVFIVNGKTDNDSWRPTIKTDPITDYFSTTEPFLYENKIFIPSLYLSPVNVTVIKNWDGRAEYRYNIEFYVSILKHSGAGNYETEEVKITRYISYKK